MSDDTSNDSCPEHGVLTSCAGELLSGGTLPDVLSGHRQSATFIYYLHSRPASSHLFAYAHENLHIRTTAHTYPLKTTQLPNQHPVCRFTGNQTASQKASQPASHTHTYTHTRAHARTHTDIHRHTRARAPTRIDRDGEKEGKKEKRERERERERERGRRGGGEENTCICC